MSNNYSTPGLIALIICIALGAFVGIVVGIALGMLT